MAKGQGSENLEDLEIDADAVGGPKPSPRGSPPMYVDIDKLKNSDDLVAIISQRRANGVITFAVFKEFERDRRAERTSFIAESLGQSYLDLVKLALERIAKIKNDQPLLKQLVAKAYVDLGYTQAEANQLAKAPPTSRGGR